MFETGMGVAFWTLVSSAALAIADSASEPNGGQLADRPLVGAVAHPAIGYYSRPTSDLLVRAESPPRGRRVTMVFDERVGYLNSTLDALHVPVESQMLVMSKTGIQGLHTGAGQPARDLLQRRRDGRLHPRRAAARDRDSGSAAGRRLLHHRSEARRRARCSSGAKAVSPAIRPTARCTCRACWSAACTSRKDGLPLGQFGSFDPDDRTPFRQRWGGWYVTGTHGAMRHMGQRDHHGRKSRRDSRDRTLDRTSLDDLFDTKGYLSATSDIAALMVFLHQGRAMNLVTRIGWEARIAAQGGTLDLASGPLHDGIRELVDYFLFADENR